MGELITKVLLSAFAVMYAVVVLKSIYRGEILFIQGRGANRESNPRRFFRYVLYHALVAGLFCLVALCTWLLL